MNVTLTLIDLAGTIALLLWGVHMVQTGIQRAFGPNLRRVLGRAFGDRFRAFAAGLGVTAVLQSSTATGLMAASFAAGGLVDLVPGLAVMLGANLGTTLIVQVLSFDVAKVAPLFVLIGVVLFRRGTQSRPRDLGRVAIGLGLMLLALQLLLTLVTPYEDVPSLRLLLGAIATQPLIDVILAAALTWAAHSSVAVVLLIVSFAARGVIPPEAAFALVLGANLGTALNPLLEGVIGRDPSAKRLPIGNLLNRLIGVALGAGTTRPDRPPDGDDRPRRGALGGRFSYPVQLGDGVAVPAIARSVRAAAGQDAAGPGGRRRPVASGLPRRGRPRDAVDRAGRCGA
jgi:phosphate:Na+ symporter